MGYSGKNSHSPDGGVWEILMGGGVEDSGDLGGKGGGFSLKILPRGLVFFNHKGNLHFFKY